MYVSTHVGVFVILVAVSNCYPRGYFSDLQDDDDDGLKRALVSVQQQRRQIVDKDPYFDPSLANYVLSGGFVPREKNEYFRTGADAEEEPEDDDVPYRAILDEIIRRMKEQPKDDLREKPVNEAELSGIFGPPYSELNYDTPSTSSDEEALEDLFETDERDNEGQNDDDRDIMGSSEEAEDYSAAKEKRSEQPVEQTGDSDLSAISYEQLKTDLIEKENEELMDALDLATLSQITGSAALIPNEIGSIKKAIDIEDLLQGVQEQLDQGHVTGNEEKRGDANEEVLHRVHHAQLPAKASDECPVTSYEFSCEFAANLGEEFVDLCRRHDICYSCGEVNGISRAGCDEGFLEEGEQICDNDWCTLKAARMFLQMQKNHQRAPDAEDLDQCRNPCVRQYIAYGTLY